MASKYQLKDNSFYIKRTDIPINKFNIDDSETLHEIEKELLEEAYLIFVDELDESTVFDENYLKELHKRTFESLYEWAGVFRDFNMAKGDSRFCQGAYVNNESKKIFEALKKEKPLPAEIVHIKIEETGFREFNCFAILDSDDGDDEAYDNQTSTSFYVVDELVGARTKHQSVRRRTYRRRECTRCGNCDSH